MRCTHILTCIAAALLVPSAISAQDSLVPGVRIRVSARSLGVDREEGVLVAARADSLIVAFDERGRRAFAKVAVTLLEAKRPGNEAKRGAAVGGFLGALGGYSLGLYLPLSQSSSSATCTGLCGDDARLYSAGSMALMLGMLGAIAGAMIGADIVTWQPVPGWRAAPHLSVDHGRPGIGLSVAF